eukprot:TRINITY_DN16840_c0_g1_i1.p1 TRINITY_DN16840_c0_g1~~TRINITY_DN16840_c0_g1_i1.p1  ORF type:complete len:775 (-),score=122.91 TRINITY_DN16840_c0_g1_i1:262-2586(-)
MNRFGRSEGLRVPTLADLCCASLAKAINNETCDCTYLPDLPGELSERILGSLSAQSFLTNETLLCVASPHLRSLNLANMKQRASHPDEVGIRDALKICTSVEDLNCHGCTIDESVLDLIHSSPFSSNLKTLDLSSCTGVTSSGLRGILLNCTRLETLNLSGCPITDDAFDVLAYSAGSVTHDPSPEKGLKRKLEDETHVAEEKTSSRKRAKRAEEMDFSFDAETDTELDAEPVQEFEQLFGQPLVYLRSLSISGCCSLTNRGLQLIPKLFPYLTHLDCSHIDRDNLDISPILSQCAFVKSLNINGCKIDQSGSFLSNKHVALEEIEFCGTGTLNANFYELLAHCAASLRVVRLRNKSFSLGEGRENDPTDWLQQCRSLVTLDLYSVSVGESALSQLLSTRCVDTLEMLDITHCHVPERDLKLLCNTPLPVLRSLSLNHVAISQWTLDLGRNCPLLTHLCLNLDLKALLPERDVPQLLNGLHSLRNLELWCCKSLSQATVLTILEMCPDMKCLLLSTASSEEPVEDADAGEGDDDSEWSEEDDNAADKRNDRARAGEHDHEHDHDHDHDHDHEHKHPGCDTISWLSDEEFSYLTRTYPHVQFKVWNHTISGNRHFRFHNGDTPHDAFERLVTPLKVNELGVRLKVQNQNGAHEIVPMVLVDNIPIWSHETSASLHHLRKTTDGCDGGALPLISEWCCECNIESYNGVLFYHDADSVFWETHEPGVKQRFVFSKGQYITAINNARLQYMQLAWKLQRLRWVQQQQQANQADLVSCA